MSPRGESIQFSNPEFCLKWNGSTDKNISILQDNDENQLLATLMSYVSHTDDANNGDEGKLCDQTENEHVVQNGLTEEQSTWQNCKKLYENIQNNENIK